MATPSSIDKYQYIHGVTDIYSYNVAATMPWYGRLGNDIISIKMIRDTMKNSPNHLSRTVTVTSLLLVTLGLGLLSACGEAVRAPKVATYRIQGQPSSTLYPLSVKEMSEDVVIQLKANTQAPVAYSVDTEGKSIPFNYHVEGNTLTIPGKFDHLILTRPDASRVDIFRNF
jgi:hypothetical protein